MLRKLIGTRAFYKRLLLLIIPIMVQNGITNFVNMLDNIMIGAVGTAQMTGVSIANQLIFVFNICIFGAVSGAGIFGTQFFGSKDYESVRHTFRFKFLFGTLLTAVAVALFFFAGEPLLKLYMQGEQGLTDAAEVLYHAKGYLLIMLLGLFPYTIVQCYSSTLRESANPTLPMKAGLAAVLVNLVFNYFLIFGKLGFPELGVNGAAIATVLSRFVELAIVVIGTHTSPRYAFIKGVYRTFRIPASLVWKLFIKGLPLLLNEALWAVGIAIVNQSYSMRGLDAMAAVNISQTFWNVFSIAYLAIGNAVGIILGQMLGADELEEAKPAAYQMIAFSCAISTAIAVLYSIIAEFVPYVYNTEPEIRQLATRLMQITAVMMPFYAITHASYFALRSGGKMLITFLFDCGFEWGVSVVLAFVLSRFTSISFLGLFAVVQGASVLKMIIGVYLVKKGSWVKNITT